MTNQSSAETSTKASRPRRVTSKILDLNDDGELVVYGLGGEYLIVENGPAQIIGLAHSIKRYLSLIRADEKPLG